VVHKVSSGGSEISVLTFNIIEIATRVDILYLDETRWKDDYFKPYRLISSKILHKMLPENPQKEGFSFTSLFV